MSTKKYLFSDYSKNQRNGLQGWGNGLIGTLIERYSPTKKNLSVLELGGSSGEHIQFIEQDQLYTWQRYVVIDLYPGKSDHILFKKMLSKKAEFISANIELMPFKNKTFDLVISTCVFAYDKIKTLYFPFRIKSWNINLVALIRIEKNG